MKLSFYFSLLFLILYLALDVIMVDAGRDQRPIVQLFAGLGLLSMTFYNLVYVKKLKKIFQEWSFLLFWGLFVLLIAVYYLFSLYGLPTEYANSFFRNVVVAMFIFVTIIFFYNSTVNKHLKSAALLILISALFINGLFEIYHAFTFTKIRQGVEMINTSAGYIFVMMLPLLMYKFRKENIWVFGLTLMLTLLTGKRGALVIFLVLAMYSSLYYDSIRKQGKFNWKTFLFIGILMIGGGVFYVLAFESFQFRVSNVVDPEGNIGSGRNIIWFTLISYWLDSHLLYQLIGSGLYSTINIMRFVAHNDIIQYLVDFGIIGLSVWLVVLVKFYNSIQKVKKHDRYIYLLLMFCLFVLIGRGLFAGTLRTDNIYLSISIGYLLGVYQLNFNRVFIKLEGVQMQNEIKNKVNTFIIGAQKAGTTSLYQWLGQHPKIHAPSEIKDYHFFCNDHLYDKGIPHFNKLYKKNNAKIQLHSAVNYLYFYEQSAKRIYEYNPDAKLIICLRNPAFRAISAYKYFVRALKERQSLEDAINRELKGELSEDEMSDLTYLGHGLYKEQIEGYLKYFKEEQIHIVLFEELTDPNHQTEAVDEILRFLNLDTSFVFDYTHMNKSGKPKSRFLNWLIRENHFFKVIKYILPWSLRKSIGKKIREKNISDKEIEVQITDKVKAQLIEYYKKSVRELDKFIEKDLNRYWEK